jgi:hypothetical protein
MNNKEKSATLGKLTSNLNSVRIKEVTKKEISEKRLNAEYSLRGDLFKLTKKGIKCFQKSVPERFIESLTKLEKDDQSLAACFRKCSKTNNWPSKINLKNLKVSKPILKDNYQKGRTTIFQMLIFEKIKFIKML